MSQDHERLLIRRIDREQSVFANIDEAQTGKRRLFHVGLKQGIFIRLLSTTNHCTAVSILLLMDSRYHLPIRQACESPKIWSTGAALQYTDLQDAQSNDIHHYMFVRPSLPQSQLQLSAHATPQQRGQHLQNTSSVNSPLPNSEALFFHQSYAAMAPGQAMSMPHTPVTETVGLPQPLQILPSQGSSPTACLACGKAECHLSSHRYFSQHVMADTRGRLHAMQHQVYTRGHATGLTPQTSTRTKPWTDGPMSLTAEQSHMLSLWTQEWSPVKLGPERHLFPFRLIDFVMPAAKRHTALFHALVAYAGIMWSHNNGTSSADALQAQTLAVNSLSTTCSTADLASTDEAILSALLLMLIYMAQGEMLQVQTHIDGLAYLVKLRGGLHYIGLAGLVTEFLLYADYLQALYFSRTPIWSLPLPALEIGPQSGMGAGFGVAVTNREIDAVVGTTARGMCEFATLAEMALQNLPAPKQMGGTYGSYPYLASITEYQLALQNFTYLHSHTVNECVLLALIMFNQVVLRGNEPIGPVVRAVEHRFWTAFESMEKRRVHLRFSPCLYIWMIMMGLSLCMRGNCAHRASAIKKLRTARIRAAVVGWKQCHTMCLDRYVWLRIAQESTYRRIWAEVEAAEPSRDLHEVG